MTKVECLICHHQFEAITSGHVRACSNKHKLSPPLSDTRSYRVHFGLKLTDPLMSDQLREVRREAIEFALPPQRRAVGRSRALETTPTFDADARKSLSRERKKREEQISADLKERGIVPVGTVAGAVSIPKTTLLSALQTGRLGGEKVGGRWVTTEDEVEKAKREGKMK